jgi:hypothetical protein
LDDLIKLWEKLYRTPQQQYVLELLKELRHREPKSLPTFEIGRSYLPTAANLLYDLDANDDVQYRSTVTDRDAGKAINCFATWDTLSDNPGADTTKRLHCPYTAWGINPSSPYGIQDCGFQIPDALRESSVFISPVLTGDELSPTRNDKEPLFHSIYTPAGTITDIHDDGVLNAAVLVQLYGTKGLFTWPGTAANRAFFADSHGSTPPLRLREAGNNMPDGFKLTILKPGIAVNLDPGMIRAVISPVNSAIGSWDYVDAKWLGADQSKVKEGAKWALDLAKIREDPLPNDADPAELYRPIVYGLNLWKCLLQVLVKDGDDRARQVQDLVHWLESEITRQYAGEAEGDLRKRKRRPVRGSRKKQRQ